jgi:hypothetical protein
MDITADGWLVIISGSLGEMPQVCDAETGIKLFDLAARTARRRA